MLLKVETDFKADEVIPVGLRLSLLGLKRKANFREKYFYISTAASVY